MILSFVNIQSSFVVVSKNVLHFKGGALVLIIVLSVFKVAHCTLKYFLKSEEKNFIKTILRRAWTVDNCVKQQCDVCLGFFIASHSATALFLTRFVWFLD